MEDAVSPSGQSVGDVNDARSYPATRVDETGPHRVHDVLVVEAPLHIRVNGDSFTTTMRTPGSDRALTRGLLFTEGILRDGAVAMGFLERRDPEDGEVSVIDVSVEVAAIAKPVAGMRSLLSSASCGVCGTRDPDDLAVYGEAIALRDSPCLALRGIVEIYSLMAEKQELFRESGGAHGAALFDDDLKLLSLEEDVGRHNAVDKSIGRMLERDALARATRIAVSGRISYEIVYKTYRAGIGVLLAVGAVSSMAVTTADRLGLTLAGFCREGRATVYTHAERIEGAASAVQP